MTWYQRLQTIIGISGLLSAPWIALGQQKLVIYPGLDRYARDGSSTPLTVDIPPLGVSGPAVVRIQRNAEGRTLETSIPIQLAASAPTRAQFNTPFDGELLGGRVEVVQGSRVLAATMIEGVRSVDPVTPLLAALSLDRGGFSHLIRTPLPLSSRVDPYGGSNPMSASQSGASNAMAFPAPGLLPDSVQGYSAVDIVILGDLPLDALSPNQWTSLVDWVRGGGSLIISGGSDLQRLNSARMKEVLPVKVTGVSQSHSLAAMGSRYGTQAPSNMPIALCRANANGLEVVGDSGLPLVVSGRIGLGGVVFAAMDLSSPTMRSWPGSAALWRDMADSAQPINSYRKAFRRAVGERWGSSSSVLIDALAGQESTQAPGVGLIGLFLGAYVLLVAPINYLIMKRFDRREMMWVTAPVIVLAFTGGAYVVGRSLKGSNLQVAFATLVEFGSGEDRGEGITVANIYSPAMASYDLAARVPRAAVSEIAISNWMGSSSRLGDLRVQQGPETIIRGAGISMWDHRTFAFEGTHEIGGTLTAYAEPIENGRLRVRTANQTKWPLHDCAATAGGAIAKIGTLKPGETKTVELSAISTGGIATIMAPMATSRSTRVLNGLATLLQNGAVDAQTRPAVRVMGWTDQEMAGLSLQGGSAKTVGVTLLIAYASTPPTMTSLAAPLPGSAQLPQTRPTTGIRASTGLTDQERIGQIAAQTSQQASALNNQVYAFLQQGQIDAALNSAKQADAADPGNGMILDSLGEVYLRKKNYPDAISSLRKAIQAQGGGGIGETNVKLGQAYVAIGSPGAAKSHFRRALKSTDARWKQAAQQELASLGSVGTSPGTVRGAVTLPPTARPGATITYQVGNQRRGAKQTIKVLPDGRREVRTESWKELNGSRVAQDSVRVFGAQEAIPPVSLPQ